MHVLFPCDFNFLIQKTNIEHIFLYLLAIWVCSFVKWLFIFFFFVNFLQWVSVFSLLTSKKSLYILYILPSWGLFVVYIHYKYLFQLSSLPFHSDNGIIWVKYVFLTLIYCLRNLSLIEIMRTFLCYFNKRVHNQ